MGLELLLILLAGGEPRLAAQPSPQEVQRLLEDGYQRKQAGDLEGALAAFEQARGLGADAQRIALELSYLQVARGRFEEANQGFTEASLGPDSLLARQARQELEALPHHLWADLYVDTLGWSRTFGSGVPADLVPTLRGRVFVRPSLNLDLHFYLFTQVTRDTASRGRDSLGIPEIYADNYTLAGLGVLARFWSHRAGLFVQAGPAFNLLDDGRRRVSFDARAGLYFGLESSSCRPRPSPGVGLMLAPCTDAYGESVYISRFDHNVVGFLRGRAALSWLHTGPVLWQGLLEARAAADRLGHYYNNLADAGVGHRWRLLAPIGFDLQLALHGGRYFGRHSVDPLPAQLQYTDLRLQAATYVEF
jgi:hypothetical protein